MIHRQSITLNDFAKAKETELNFWVAVFGITTGIILGFLLLRTFFQATLSEQVLIREIPQQNKMFQQQITPAGYGSSDGISV